MKRYKVDQCEPFSIDAITGPSDYSANNILIRQVNFPAYFHKSDIFARIWSDKISPVIWQNAAKFFEEKYSKYNFIGRVQSCLPDDFLEWIKILAVDALPKDTKITGARLVRYTNAATLFAIYAIDIFIKSDKTPDVPLYSGGYAPNVKKSKRLYFQDTDSYEINFEDNNAF